MELLAICNGITVNIGGKSFKEIFRKKIFFLNFSIRFSLNTVQTLISPKTAIMDMMAYGVQQKIKVKARVIT